MARMPLLTPGSVASLLGMVIDAFGNLKGQYIPRTNTLTNLLALDGGPGEISSPTDAPALVKHSGVAGEAVPIMSMGATRQYDVTADATFTIAAYWQRFVFNAQNSIYTLNVSLANGFYIGQCMWITMICPNGQTAHLAALDGAAFTLDANFEYEIMWTGTLWTLKSRRGNLDIGNPYPLSMSLAGGAVVADKAIAVGPNAAANFIYSAAFAFSSGIVQTWAQGEYSFGYGQRSSEQRNDLYLVTAATTAATLLAKDGTGVMTLNPTPGLARIRIDIFGQNGSSTANVWAGTREILVAHGSSASSIIGSVQTIGTDYQNGTVTAPSAISITLSTRKLAVTITPSASVSTKWTAVVRTVQA